MKNMFRNTVIAALFLGAVGILAAEVVEEETARRVALIREHGRLQQIKGVEERAAAREALQDRAMMEKDMMQSRLEKLDDLPGESVQQSAVIKVKDGTRALETLDPDTLTREKVISYRFTAKVTEELLRIVTNKAHERHLWDRQLKVGALVVLAGASVALVVVVKVLEAMVVAAMAVVPLALVVLAALAALVAALAAEAGADVASIRVVEMDEIPLSYMPGNVTRPRDKAVGDLAAAGG